MDKDSKKKSDSKLLKHLWKLVKPYIFRLVVSVSLITLGKGVLALVPLGIKFGIDVIQANSHKITLFTISDYPLIVDIVDISLFLFAILIIQFVFSYSQVIVTNKFSQNILKDLRTYLFTHITKQSLSFFNKNKVGQLLTRVVHDIQTLNELFVTGISTIIGDFFLIICIIVISFMLDVKLAIVSFGILPFLYLGTIIFKKYARKSFLEIRVKLAKINAFTQATISGIKVIQVHNKQNRLTRLFRKLQKSYLVEYLKTVKIYSYYFPSVEFLSVFSRLMLLLFGAYWISTGETPISIVVAFLFYSPMFFQPLRELSEQFNVLQAALASSERIFSLLDVDQEIKDDPDAVSLKDVKGTVEFKNVHFSYQEKHKILSNISFKINAGEKIALVGVTGSGKSTIISLISRLYDIEKGEILIDGVNIKKIKKSSLRKVISYVLQDVFIFSSTIKENIRLFDHEIEDGKVKDASENVSADNFINKLSNGLDTELGERGLGLSFGEKQLLAFARAFIHNSKIVIFDEATSNIDLKTEALIQKNIKEILKDKTAIIIAHRLSTIKEVDKIIVIQKGEIKEIGTHEELLKKDGYYKKLYQFQFQEYSSMNRKSEMEVS